MKKNIGSTDKIIRLVIAAILIILYFTKTVTGTFGIVLLVVAGIAIITALLNFCGLYSIVGVNTCTCKKK